MFSQCWSTPHTFVACKQRTSKLHFTPEERTCSTSSMLNAHKLANSSSSWQNLCLSFTAKHFSNQEMLSHENLPTGDGHILLVIVTWFSCVLLPVVCVTRFSHSTSDVRPIPPFSLSLSLSLSPSKPFTHSHTKLAVCYRPAMKLTMNWKSIAHLLSCASHPTLPTKWAWSIWLILFRRPITCGIHRDKLKPNTMKIKIHVPQYSKSKHNESHHDTANIIPW